MTRARLERSARIDTAPGCDVTDDPTITDAELVRRCLDADQAAWSALVDRYQRLVFSVALRSGCDRNDADDVFQVVFTTLYRRLHALRDVDRLASWLITTAQREAWRVARARRPLAELDERTEDSGPLAADVAEAADRDQRVRQAMAQLDDRCRGLLTALFLESDRADYAALAARLGMPVGSIGPTRGRCLKKLERLLAAAGIDGGS